ncbi:MAG: NADH-quinone oxidoreductase subunit L [Methanophagales archaeon]|nr:NADH-quinone oxidoreductase subunit L [Methanophagales archaeon]
MNEWLVFLLLFLSPVVSSVPIALAYKSKRWTDKLPYLSVLGIFVSVLMSLYIFFVFPENQRYAYDWIPDLGINIVLITDYLSRYMGVITAVIAFFIAIYGLEYMRGDYRPSWYWFFFNLFTASMLLVVYSDNLFLLFVGWEGLGAASWGLIGHWFRDDDEIAYVGVPKRKVGPLELSWPPSFGGWRAISTIRFGDVPMFFAIAAIWVFAGNLNISEINWESLFLNIGAAGTVILLILFLMGLLTKSAQVPFSEWLMTAMTGPTTVSALLHSATMVAAGAFVFIKISWYIRPWELHHVPGLNYVYIFALFIGLISGLYGALAASGMLERKVLLAASTMSSLGLMFGAAAASYWVHEEVMHGINVALLVAFWYMAVHAFAKASLFLVSGHLIHATHTRFSVGNLEFGKRMKIAFITTIIATAFLVGIPPLTAYWVKSMMDEVKLHLFHHAVETGTILMAIPIFLLILTSLVYAAILAKFLSLNFIKGEKPEHEHLEGGGLMKLGYVLMASVLFVLAHRIFVLEETEGFVTAGSEMLSIGVGVAILIVYVGAIFKPRISAFSSSIGAFFNDRMYLPFVNDYILPKTGFFVSRLVQDYGNRGIDGFFNTRVMPGLFERISKGIRIIQTGYLKTYIRIVLGLVMIFLVIASIGGMLI